MTVLPAPPVPGRIVIDVSHWQGVIDWSKVYAAGVRRAVYKITDGRNVGDPLAGYNARAGREAGVSVDPYHFLRPNEGVVEQLDVFVAALYGVRWPELGGDGNIAFDGEATGGLSPYYLRAFYVKAWKYMLERLLENPDCYARMTFWNRFVGTIDWKKEGLIRPRLWSADYGTNGLGGGITGPRWINIVTFDGWSRWQYTSKGKVDGIKSSVDLSVEK